MINDLFFLRKVTQDDIHDVFNLSNQDFVRKYSIKKNFIMWEDHQKWFHNILSNSLVSFYVITDKSNRFIGQVRFSIQKKHAIVSISIIKDVMGKGYSLLFLREAITLFKKEHEQIKTIVAMICTENIASMKLFEKSGFIQSSLKDGFYTYIYSL